MISQRSILRASQRLAFQSRIPTLRSSLQQRYATTESPPLTGAADNAFNRERRAIKAHAAATSDIWRKLSIYVVIPCLLIASANAWVLWQEHWEHQAHLPPMSERPQYAYLNIRTKKFPWGDGNKTLFWNDKVNYIKEDE